MARALRLLVLAPVALALVAFAIANRAPVALQLDPLTAFGAPGVGFTAPLFVSLIGAVLAGSLLGGAAVWLSQGRHRRALRARTDEARRAQAETGALKAELDRHEAAARAAGPVRDPSALGGPRAT
ncbi:MAG: LapA family protein [Hyphomicrobiales bacterium]|nr:LapA family protein [Hyphomicrobiales bacterium]